MSIACLCISVKKLKLLDIVCGCNWTSACDSLVHVAFGKCYWADGFEVAEQRFTYWFDEIGNRKSSGGGLRR